MGKIGYKRIDVRSIDSFKRHGYDYKKVAMTDYYVVWALTVYDDKTNTLTRYGYEVWKPNWVRMDDGTLIWRKLTDEEFKDMGWYCPTAADKDIRIQKILQEYLQNIQ